VTETLVSGSTQSWFNLILSLCWRQWTQEDNEKQHQSGQLVAKWWQQTQAAQIWSRRNKYLLEIEYCRSAEDCQHLHKHKVNRAVKAAISGTGWYGKHIYRKLGYPLHVTVPSTAAPITDFKISAITYWSLFFFSTSHVHHVMFVTSGQVPGHTQPPVQWYPVLLAREGAGLWFSPPIPFYCLVADVLDL
jgi:hypothetical protein